MENKVKVLISFIIGGAIGSGIAVLYAPKPGSQLRTDISQKTKEIIEDGKNSSGQLWSDTKVKVGNIMDGANELLSKAKNLIVDEAKKVKSAVSVGYKTYNYEAKSIEGETSSMMPNEESSKN